MQTEHLKTILALDLGTQTGWALSYRNQVTSGTISFKPSRYEGGGMRYLRFRKWLDDLKQTVGDISEVYFEEVRNHAGNDAAHVYGGFMGQLTSWCEDQTIPYLGIPISHIKKFATGKGNASKQEVISSIISMGHNPKDDNEADALALLLYKL